MSGCGRDGSAGAVTDNEIFDNGWSGISLTNDANPHVARNRVHSNGDHGLWADKTVYRGSYISNWLSGNKSSDVYPDDFPDRFDWRQPGEE